MTDRFEQVRRQAMHRRLQPKAPARPAASSDGRRAFQAGEALTRNPHPPHSPEHQRWRLDWLSAREDVT